MRQLRREEKKKFDPVEFVHVVLITTERDTSRFRFNILVVKVAFTVDNPVFQYRFVKRV